MTLPRRNLIALAILLVLPILLLLPALLSGKALLPAAMLGNMLPWKGTVNFPAAPPWNPLQFDGIAQFYPWRLFASQTLRGGYLPLWNPYQFCGTPFLANDQSAVLYPLNLLFAIFPVAKAFAISAVAHLFLTGAFLFAFLRRRVGVLAALAGAIIWQLSTWQISWLALPTFLCTSTWIPLALLLVEYCAERPSAGRGAALGLCLGVMLLAGHLQVAFYGILIVVPYGLLFLFRRDETKERRRSLVWAFLAAAAVMLAICSPQILPTLELARVSNRAGGGHASLAGYSSYVALAMPWRHLATLLAPSFFGRVTDYWDSTRFPYSECACFIGVGGLLLAWQGIVSEWKKSVSLRFYAISALLSMLVALGTPVAALLYFGIPGFASTGSPARILVLWTLSVAILAAYGLESLQTKPLLKPAVWLTIASALLPLMGAILWLESINPALLRQIDRTSLALALLFLALSLAAAMLAKRSQWRQAATVALVALVAADLFHAGFGFNLVADDSEVYPTTPAIAWLQEHSVGKRIAVVNAQNGVYELPNTPGVLQPNSAMVYGLRDLQGYDSLQTGQYKEFLAELNGGADSSPQENGNMDLTHYEAAVSPKAAGELGIGWIISPVALGSAAEAVVKDPSVFVYAEPVGGLPRLRTIDASGEWAGVDVLSDLPTRLSVRTRSAGDLIVADQWYPGWTATVNGRPEAIKEAPDVFQTISAVPADALVKTSYQPDSLRLGLYLMSLGLLASAWLAAAALRRSPR